MAIRFVACLVLLSGLGCATPKVTVRVDSYAGAGGIARAAPLCFAASADANLSNRTRHAELVAACSRAARDVGINVVPEGTPSCNAAQLAWRTKKAGAYGGRTTLGLDGILHEDTIYYAKTVDITVTAAGATAFESRADLATQNPDFSDTTAYVACHAIFHEYPSRVANKRYTVAEPKK
jgi:hypothetical protein